MRVLGQEVERLSEGINEPVCDVKTTTVLNDIKPNIVKFSFRLPARNCEASARRGLLCGETGSTALFHFLGKLPHGFLSDHASFAACQGGFRDVDRGKNLLAPALTLLPQRERFLNCGFSVSA